MIDDGSCPEGRSAVDLYFLQDDGASFKATILYDPYFYVACKVFDVYLAIIASAKQRIHSSSIQPGTEAEVEEYLRRKFSRYLQSLSIIEKEDLKLVSFDQYCNLVLGSFPNKCMFRPIILWERNAKFSSLCFTTMTTSRR